VSFEDRLGHFYDAPCSKLSVMDVFRFTRHETLACRQYQIYQPR